MVIKKGEDSLPTKIMKLVNFEQFGLTFSYVTECDRMCGIRFFGHFL